MGSGASTVTEKHDLTAMEISAEDIVTSIKLLKSAYYLPPDGVPSALVKKWSWVLIHPLLLIFSRSLSEGNYPEVWKRAYVTPIFKQGDKSDIANYRPICILSPIATLLENIVNTKLFARFSHHIYGHPNMDLSLVNQ